MFDNRCNPKWYKRELVSHYLAKKNLLQKYCPNINSWGGKGELAIPRLMPQSLIIQCIKCVQTWCGVAVFLFTLGYGNDSKTTRETISQGEEFQLRNKIVQDMKFESFDNDLK